MIDECQGKKYDPNTIEPSQVWIRGRRYEEAGHPDKYWQKRLASDSSASDDFDSRPIDPNNTCRVCHETKKTRVKEHQKVI